MSARERQQARYWPTPAACHALGGHTSNPDGIRCGVCGEQLHHITVTVGRVGEAIGRAWVDCTCGISRPFPTKSTANTAALGHYAEVYGTSARDQLVAQAVTAGKAVR